MEKTLILFNVRNAYYFDRIDNLEMTIQPTFEKFDGLKMILWKFLRKIKSPFTCFMYADWYKDVKKYDKIVVMDTAFSEDTKLLDNIVKKTPNSQHYFYSWNVVKNEERFWISQEAAQKAGFKFYSYDCGDCEKYNLNFNTIMYDKSLKLPKVDVEYDTIFLGYLKDRKEKMVSLYQAMLDAELKPHFVVAKKDKNEVKVDLPFEYRDTYVNYYEYLDMLNKSNSVLDIAQEGQDGYSMRVMESIFFDKKLITTNVALKNADFYDENNILIIELGKTSKEEIHSFFEKEFHPYSEAVKEYYSFEAWVERFK